MVCWCVYVCRTVYQIVTDRIVQTPRAEPPTSFLCRLLDVLKLMWISRLHSGGCQLPTVYPNSFLLSIDFSTMCQINWLPAQKAVKWTPWHFEFSAVIFLCQPLVTSRRKLLSASCLLGEDKESYISFPHWVFASSLWATWWPTFLCMPHQHMGGQLAVSLIKLQEMSFTEFSFLGLGTINDGPEKLDHKWYDKFLVEKKIWP